MTTIPLRPPRDRRLRLSPVRRRGRSPRRPRPRPTRPRLTRRPSRTRLRPRRHPRHRRCADDPPLLHHGRDDEHLRPDPRESHRPRRQARRPPRIRARDRAHRWTAPHRPRHLNPLYRPLRNGLRGDDVSALQAELARLGYTLSITGSVDWSTRWALADLLGIDDGAGGVPAEIPCESVVWIPAPSVTAASLDIALGQSLDPAEPMLSVTDSSERGVLTLPDEAIAGDRVLTLSTGALPVPADGVITDPETLTAIKDSDQYRAFSAALGDGEGVFTVPWSLAAPISALVVPPSSLFGIVGADACIAQNGDIHRVQIIGSQLGQSYITSDDPLTVVDLHTEGLACR